MPVNKKNISNLNFQSQKDYCRDYYLMGKNHFMRVNILKESNH